MHLSQSLSQYLTIAIATTALWSGIVPLAQSETIQVEANSSSSVPFDSMAYWQQRTVWRTVQVPTGGFRILMPEQPRYITQGSSDAPLEEQNFVTAIESSYGALYMVGWRSAPGAIAWDTVAQAELFEYERQALLSQFDGELLQADDVELQGNPGKNYKFLGQVDGETYVMTHRSYLMGDRLYQITVVVPEAREPGFMGMAEGFIDSFQPL